MNQIVNENSSVASVLTDDVEIERLAKLNSIEDERQREGVSADRGLAHWRASAAGLNAMSTNIAVTVLVATLMLVGVGLSACASVDHAPRGLLRNRVPAKAR